MSQYLGEEGAKAIASQEEDSAGLNKARKASTAITEPEEDDEWNELYADEKMANGVNESVVNEPKVGAPKLGTLVYGRILKRRVLIPCESHDKPKDLVKKMLKMSKRSQSMSPEDIVAVINTRTMKVMKEKSVAMKHKHVELYDELWMVTYREWNHFLKWMKKVGKTPTRHGKEVDLASPTLLRNEEFNVFVVKYNPALSIEERRMLEKEYMQAQGEMSSYPESPSGKIRGGLEKTGTPDGTADINLEMASVTPQVAENVVSPTPIKEKARKIEPRDSHMTGRHDDIDPSSMHSSRMKKGKGYTSGLFKEALLKVPSAPTLSKTAVEKPVSEKKGSGHHHEHHEHQKHHKGVSFEPGQVSQTSSGDDSQKLNPHFFGHPSDLKTPFHKREGASIQSTGSSALSRSSSVSSDRNLEGSSSDTPPGTGLRIDLFPGSTSSTSSLKTGEKRLQKRYSIATSTPQAFKGAFAPTADEPTEHSAVKSEKQALEPKPTPSMVQRLRQDSDSEVSVVSSTDHEVSKLTMSRPGQDQVEKPILLDVEKDVETAQESKLRLELEAALAGKEQHSQQLKEAEKVREALEGRLEETRTMLKILSTPSGGGGSSERDDVRVLELQLGEIEVSTLNSPKSSSPYPIHLGSSDLSDDSSRQGTPGTDVDVPIRRPSSNKQGLSVDRVNKSQRAIAPRLNVYKSTNTSSSEFSPLMTQRHLVEASEEQDGADNVLLDLVDHGNEDLRIAKAHASHHLYADPRELNDEEQAEERAKEKVREDFLLSGPAEDDAPKGSPSRKEDAGPSSRDLWLSTSDTENMLQSVPKDLAKRLHKVDSRFLTAKEKLYRPFMRVHKGLGRKLFTDPRFVHGTHQSQWEICIWTVFQMYGRAGASEGAIVKCITQTQANRALKEAGFNGDVCSRLELALTRIKGPSNMSSTRRLTAGKKKPPPSRTSAANSSKDFGLTFPEFSNAMHMLVTMLRDSKHRVGGRGEALGYHMSAASQLKSAGVEEIKDDAWEAERARVEEKLIRLCSNNSSSTKGKSIPSVNATIAIAPEEPLLLCHSGLIGKIHSVYALEFPKLDFASCSDLLLSLLETVRAGPWEQADSSRQVWEKNPEQIKVIYEYYAQESELRPKLPATITPGSSDTSSVCGSENCLDLTTMFSTHARYSRQQDNGTNAEKMMSFENLKAFLTDFEVFPHHIDFQTLARVYRSVKLWEWAWCDSLSAKYESGTPLNLGVADPLGFVSASGTMSITAAGFIEVLTRVAHIGCRHFHADEGHVKEALVFMLRLMNQSRGRERLLMAKRRSVSLRPFAI